MLKSFPLHQLGESEADIRDMMNEGKPFIAACYGEKDLASTSFTEIRLAISFQWGVKPEKQTNCYT